MRQPKPVWQYFRAGFKRQASGPLPVEAGAEFQIASTGSDPLARKHCHTHQNRLVLSSLIIHRS
jgi:hypothetical protein